MHHLGRRVRAPLLLAVLLLLFAPRAGARETDCSLHDPSAIIQDGGTFWVFGSGHGIAVYSSTDRLHWTPRPSVFDADPAWIAGAVPGHRAHEFWAPDVRRIGGLFSLYYAVSVFGRNTSAIGLATSPSLQSPHWTDRGLVLRSDRSDHFNAIDPCAVSDAAGGLWLCFGSFWSGIKITPLDPATGQALPGAPVYGLAAHPQDHEDSIEASYLTAHGGYYYLFVNWGYCCRGARSTYSIRVGRARAVLGPYLDQDGRDMRAGGGSVFLDTAGGGGPGRAEVGPGQAGLETDASGDWFSCHDEWAQDRQGMPTLNVTRLVWAADGWPALSGP